ncbi:hypothetical protein [Nocardioides campestrisoli]|uniref:hypothetical protein n=1 Tax=Nocardioides campestrisoli TaxID=2736757 RepID=UPI0015E7048C|nr:hypothetical protein [Nocardioides campestrisoli]
MCFKTVANAAHQRLHEAERKGREWHDGTFTRWGKEFSSETPNHFLDGVTLWVSGEPPPTT